MKGADKPVVTIVHSLPGRVRTRVSRPPRDFEQMRQAIMEHRGLQSVDYAPVTQSVLVRHDAQAVAQEEVVLRIALHLSLDYGAVPVRLLAEPERSALTDGAVYSAMAVGAAQLARWLGNGKGHNSPLDWAAGVGTACAVFGHAWQELRERGNFDPEALSLAYLATAFLRGNFRLASAATWFVTFGRHLFQAPATGVEVRPLKKTPGRRSGELGYELVVGPDLDAPQRVRVQRTLRSVLKLAMTGGGARGGRSLWEELRQVSRVHGEVLEGFGKIRNGIPMRFY